MIDIDCFSYATKHLLKSLQGANCALIFWRSIASLVKIVEVFPVLLSKDTVVIVRSFVAW